MFLLSEMIKNIKPDVNTLVSYKIKKYKVGKKKIKFFSVF